MKFSYEEIAYRARQVQEYLSLPLYQRREYAEKHGLSVSLMNYWKKVYTPEVVEKARELADLLGTEQDESQYRPRRKAQIQDYPWHLNDIQLSNGWTSVSVSLTDDIHHAIRISAPAEFKAGNLSSKCQKALADRIQNQLAQWNYDKADRTDLDFMLRQLWR